MDTGGRTVNLKHVNVLSIIWTVEPCELETLFDQTHKNIKTFTLYLLLFYKSRIACTRKRLNQPEAV